MSYVQNLKNVIRDARRLRLRLEDLPVSEKRDLNRSLSEHHLWGLEFFFEPTTIWAFLLKVIEGGFRAELIIIQMVTGGQ